MNVCVGLSNVASISVKTLMFQEAANQKEPRLSEWHGDGKCFVLRSRARGQVYIAVRSSQRANGRPQNACFRCMWLDVSLRRSFHDTQMQLFGYKLSDLQVCCYIMRVK